jgi:hypothetical protein
MTEEKTVIPEYVISIVDKLRDLEGQYVDISYRAGTHGERGLYQKRQSLLAQIRKLKASFASDEFRLVYKNSYPGWYIAKKD